MGRSHYLGNVDPAPGVPGKQTASAALPAGSNGPYQASVFGLQLEAARDGLDTASAHETAARGTSGSGGTLPHLSAIQRSFGKHDVSGVRAHVGGAAAEASAALGAHAYASGDSVAFAQTPDIRLAAHEAAHVVQQRGGVRLAGGIGRAGDAYEQHADAVADLVVRGDSAEALLDTMAHRGSAGGSAVQMYDGDALGGGDREPIGPRVGPVGIAPEGHFRIAQLPIQDTRIPLGPYAYVAGANFDVMVHYQVGARSDSHDGAAPPGPATEVHVGPGGARGHGEHGHGIGIQAEITHQLMDLGNGANLEVSAGGDYTTTDRTFGVGLSAGEMRFGDFVLPLPSVNINIVQFEPGRPPRALVAVLNIPLPMGWAMRSTLSHGMAVEIRLEGLFSIEVEPNWERVAPRIAELLARTGAEAATTAEGAGAATAEGAGAATAEGAGAATAEGAGAATAEGAGAATAEGAAVTGAEAVGAVAEADALAVAGGSALGLAAMVAAPLAAGASLLVIFAHETGAMEELRARSRGTAHTVFTYCMAYTMSWFGSPTVTGPGASEGAAAARADQAAHPEAVAQARARRMSAAQELYTAVYTIIAPRAEASLMRSSGTTEGTLDAMVIHDQIGQVRWNGPLFRELGA